MDEDMALVLMTPVFLIWKGLCFLFRQFLWWVVITLVVFFILRGQGIRVEIVFPVQLTEADVFTDPVVDDKGTLK